MFKLQIHDKKIEKRMDIKYHLKGNDIWSIYHELAFGEYMSYIYCYETDNFILKNIYV